MWPASIYADFLFPIVANIIRLTIDGYLRSESWTIHIPLSAHHSQWSLVVKHPSFTNQRAGTTGTMPEMIRLGLHSIISEFGDQPNITLFNVDYEST